MKYVAAVFGVLVAGFSGFMLWSTMQAATPDRHLVYLFAGGIGFGMLLVIPTLIIGTLKSLLTVVGPYLPQVMIGGRRATDPAATTATDPDPDAKKP